MLTRRSQFLGSLSIGTHSAQLEVADWARPTPPAGPGGALVHLVLRAAVPEEWSRRAVAPIKEVGDNQYTLTSDMPKGHNTCQWLTLSSTERCNKSSPGDFCKIHLAILRKSSSTLPCLSCGLALSINRGSALAVDFVVCGNGTRGGCRPNSNVWPPFPFRDVATSSIPIPRAMDEYIKHTHAANSSVWPTFRDEDTSGIPMLRDMDEYIDRLLAEMPEPAQKVVRNILDEPIPETVKRRLLKPLYLGKYRPPRPPPTWKDRKRKAILEELDHLPPQKAVQTIQDYQ